MNFRLDRGRPVGDRLTGEIQHAVALQYELGAGHR